VGATGEDRLSIAGAWLSEARQVLDRIEATQMPAIAEAATLFARAIGDGALVLLFGTGHSDPARGDVPALRVVPRSTRRGFSEDVPHAGRAPTASVAMFIERTEAADAIPANFQFGPTDVMMTRRGPDGGVDRDGHRGAGPARRSWR
jgi:hypothetical protein